MNDNNDAARNNDTQFLLRLPADLRKWIHQQAKKEYRTANSEIVMALEDWRKRQELSNKK